MLYRLRIYATDGATVESTITSSQLAEVPRIPGDIARTLEGKTEAQAWRVRMLSSAIVGDIADADGRPDLGGRLADWSEDPDDGSGFAVVWTGRLTGYASPDPATFDASLESERWKERRSTIFTSNQGTVQIYPPGPRTAWGKRRTDHIAGRTADMQAWKVDGTDAVFLSWAGVTGERVSRGALDMIIADQKLDADGSLDQGNFTHTRLNIAGTDREIISFSDDRDRHNLVDLIADDDTPPGMWVHWPAHGLTGNAELVESCYLYAPTHPPTQAVPLLIGGQNGVTDAQLAQDIYDGDYGATDESSNPVTIRYNAAAFSALRGEACWFVIDGPENMAKWLQEHVYKPRQWLPFVNADGEIAPDSVALARDIDYSALTMLTAANAHFPYPEWDYSTRDAITAVAFEVAFRRVLDRPPEEGDFPASLITTRTLRPPASEHDNISRLGRRAVTVKLDRALDTTSATLRTEIAREYFDRVGDGLIRIPEIHVKSSLAGCDPGDFVTLDHDTLKLPNLNTLDRTGDSIWQVVKKDRLPGTGFALELEYTGAAQQKLSAPTVAVAQNAANPEHAVDVTISGLTADDGWILEINRGDGAGYVVGTVGTGNGSVTLGRCPAGTSVSVRALTTRQRRIRSAYSTVASVTTAGLTAPSALSATAANRSILLTWTNGEATYPVMPTLAGADFLERPLTPGSTQFVFDGLAASTLHTVGVRHLDDFGGTSTTTTTTATTGTAATLTAPTQTRLTQSRATASEGMPPAGLGFGIEVAFVAESPGAWHKVEVATDSGFTAIIRTAIVPAGKERTQVLTSSPGELHVRVRAELSGYTSSSWSSTVTGFPTVLQATRPSVPQDLDRLNGDLDAVKVKYADLTTVESLQPAEAGAEVNPPTITNVSLTVVDNTATGNDDYTATWDHSNAVTASYDVVVEYFREGVSQGSQTSPATDDTDSFSDASGDGVVNNHHAVFTLKDSAGAVLQTITSATVSSNVI